MNQMIQTVYKFNGFEVAALRQFDGELVALSPVCRGCGCTEWNACEDGCGWAAPFLCTACAPGVFLTDQQMIELNALRDRLGVVGMDL